jgi:hypothetical protein
MRNIPRRRIWLVFVVLGTIAIASCGGVAFAMRDDASARKEAWHAARQRWEVQNLQTYRMVLQEATCVTDYQVKEGRVVWGYETPCGRYGRTVPQLFELIRQYDAAKPKCFGPECRCEQVTTLTVRYDPAFGFPQHIGIQMRLWPNWQNAAFWQAAIDTRANPCQQTGAWNITVSSFEP